MKATTPIFAMRTGFIISTLFLCVPLRLCLLFPFARQVKLEIMFALRGQPHRTQQGKGGLRAELKLKRLLFFWTNHEFGGGGQSCFTVRKNI